MGAIFFCLVITKSNAIEDKRKSTGELHKSKLCHFHVFDVFKKRNVLDKLSELESSGESHRGFYF